MLQEQTDEALMVEYQRGNARAFEILLTRHRVQIFNFILRDVRIRATAEELMQETFLRVIRGAKKYEKRAKFTTWLYTIARNLCIDHSRRQKHRRAASLDAKFSGGESGGSLMDLIPDDAVPTDREAESIQLQQKMHAAIASLGDEQREVFLLREFSGLSFREIAEIVSVPENTVKSRMRYALEKLRAALSEYEDLAREAQ